MECNDYIDDPERCLPPEAGEVTWTGFEPDDKWLVAAHPALRHLAMRQWFLTRYWDPANDTPYISSEGGYLYIHGGPYDAREELEDRFASIVSEREILEVVEDVESEGVLDWAPIHTRPDYYAEFEFEVSARDEPRQLFDRQVKEVEALAGVAVDEPQRPLFRQLLYSSLITALEAYLADTMSYWLASNQHVFRSFVCNCPEFRDRKLTVSQIFERMDRLQEDVEEYLQNQVWHRLDKVVPLMSVALSIETPPIDSLMKHIVVRHDIVHRGGRTKDGQVVDVCEEDVETLLNEVVRFVEGVEAAVSAKFPVGNSSEL
ncbi:hypothetical protein [Thioalkalivibrio sp. ALE9]|uniref:hypothetical protein n=1 Tax=Thioalkalivibrio sp. ALE9 TaxID=1158169 RepID=UPI0012DC6BAD|nr:hypothetical protein [Thioalkalivibrio sp. ALE9]